MTIDTSPWPGLTLVEQVQEGNRNEVWRGLLDGASVSVRQSRRPADSLAWELKFISFLDQHDFVVPTQVPSSTGAPSVNGVVVQVWLEGEPPSRDAHWHAVAAELQRLHNVTADYPQRPGCCTVLELTNARRSVDADLDALPPDVCEQLISIFSRLDDVPTAAIHGDPHAPNLRITSDGKVGLLDLDESRVDLVWHDLSNLHVQVLDDDDHVQAVELSHAWETANAWVAEPSYARGRLAQAKEQRKQNP